MGTQIVAALVEARADMLFFYSPYNFLRRLDSETQQHLFGTGRALQYASTDTTHQVFSFQHSSFLVQFLYAALPWDTKFFGAPVYKLFTALFTEAVSSVMLASAATAFRQHLHQQQAAYCFVELPAEDTKLAQALGDAGWRLVESRLTYFHDEVAAFRQPRYRVRTARPEEAVTIGQISAVACNDYDRFHADHWFSQEQGNQFLARYAEAAVEGYCDQVIVPDGSHMQVDAFLAISDLHEHRQAMGVGISRVVLTAVGPANRGWHQKLVSETVQRARTLNFSYVLMTTQATNRAVFRTCEKLGFKLGGASNWRDPGFPLGLLFIDQSANQASR